MKNKFSVRLRGLRNERALSGAKLASVLNKTEGAIRMWETGRSKPDADTLIKLADYFECTTDYLLGLSDYRYFDKTESELQKIIKEKDAEISRLSAQIQEMRAYARLILDKDGERGV